MQTVSKLIGIIALAFAFGQGYVPLVAASPAIDAADDAACLPTDQLGQARPDLCDIGAVEFQGAMTGVSGRERARGNR